MLKRILNISLVFLSVFSLVAKADGGTDVGYTPYSVFGMGELFQYGTAYNRTMGGVGIAARDHKILNIVNPASLSDRDSLAFMADVSLFSDNRYYNQDNIKSVSNVVNFNDCVLSFPICRKTAFMIGITPYSNTGYEYYDVEKDPYVIGNVGNVSYSAVGKGGIYQAFLGAGTCFFDRLSIGAQFNFYFGNLSRTYSQNFSEVSYNGYVKGYELQLRTFNGRFGIQYEQPVGEKSKLCVGATYSTRTKLRGTMENYFLATGSTSVDTLSHSIDTLNNFSRENARYMASEMGIGFSYKYSNKLLLEFDYTRSNWGGTNLEKQSGLSGNIVSSGVSSVFRPSVSQSFRLGVEYIPNRSDVKYYYKKVAYRAGLYYKSDYFSVDGYTIPTYALTIGASLPIFRWFNTLTIAAEVGRRGSFKLLPDNIVRETYFNISVGLNIFDIWFQRPKYE